MAFCMVKKALATNSLSHTETIHFHQAAQRKHYLLHLILPNVRGFLFYFFECLVWCWKVLFINLSMKYTMGWLCRMCMYCISVVNATFYPVKVEWIYPFSLSKKTMALIMAVVRLHEQKRSLLLPWIFGIEIEFGNFSQ